MILFDKRPIGVGTRLLTMFLDHVFMTIIVMIFFIPTIVAGFSEAFTISHEPTNMGFMQGPTLYVALFGFALYFCKDMYNGRSLAKRIFKLQVVDNRTEQSATPLQCLVRNIFCILWIVEVLVAMVNTSRRLGDRVAGTKLVYYDPTIEQPKPKTGSMLLSIVIAYGLILLIPQFTSVTEMTGTDYSQTSYNKNESLQLQRVLTDSLHEYLTPDIRIYDTVKNENLKYISIILRLKKNYIASDDSYTQLHEMTTNLVYSKFPKETFTGQIKYVYQAAGQVQIREGTIGTIVKPKYVKK